MREIIKIENEVLQPVKRRRVAAYARVSGGKDAQLHSLSTQISYYNSYIGSRGDWVLAGIYADEALTGTKEDRPEFQRLLSDCRSSKIDMVITKSITRFARNTVTLLAAVRELKSLNIDVYFEKEHIHTLSTDGELMLTLLASYAQEESRSASENVKWRIHKMFEKGIPTPGSMFGYHWENGTLEIVPEEAAVVRQIYADYLSGMGCCSIAKKLTQSGIKPKRGNLWSENSIRNMLRNEKYAGRLLLQKTYKLDHISKKKMINHGEMPMYYVENSHEAIIPPEMFEEAQQEQKRRAQKAEYNRTPPRPLLFTGLICCGSCKKRFHRKVTASAKKYPKKPFWICSTAMRYGADYCKSHRIPEDILTAKTAEVLGTADFDRETIIKHIKEIQVPKPHHLVYVLHNGYTVEVTWRYKSHKEVWTDDMKHQAREKALAQAERRKKCRKQ